MEKNVSAPIPIPKLDLVFSHTLEESQLMFYFLHFRSLPSDVFGTFRGLGDDQGHWGPLVTLENRQGSMCISGSLVKGLKSSQKV